MVEYTPSSSAVSDTIVACCTAQNTGSGALALIRISGSEALRIAEGMVRLSSGGVLRGQVSHTVHHGFVVTAQGAMCDEVLISIFHAPRTFTGEHVVEITCHNNALIIAAIINAAIGLGARPAQRGEFSHQAFLNKKIDLLQAEAIQELVQAQTAQGVQAALAQVQGSMSQLLAAIEKRLFTAIAWCEASFEFNEEGGDFEHSIKGQLAEIVAKLAACEKAFTSSMHVRNGYRIALIGAVNAGKSSLFNVLVGKKRAIVTPVAGTTRDTIEEPLVYNNQKWILVDTAGIRSTSDRIEQEGINRSLAEAAQADVIVLVVDQSRKLTNDERSAFSTLLARYAHNSVVVYSKADLPVQLDPLQEVRGVLSVSAEQERGIAELCVAIDKQLARLHKTHQLPFLVNQRQYLIFQAVIQKIQVVTGLFSQASPAYELVSAHLQEIVEILGELTGKSVKETVLDTVFKEFCVGK